MFFMQRVRLRSLHVISFSITYIISRITQYACRGSYGGSYLLLSGVSYSLKSHYVIWIIFLILQSHRPFSLDHVFHQGVAALEWITIFFSPSSECSPPTVSSSLLPQHRHFICSLTATFTPNIFMFSTWSSQASTSSLNFIILSSVLFASTVSVHLPFFKDKVVDGDGRLWESESKILPGAEGVRESDVRKITTLRGSPWYTPILRGTGSVDNASVEMVPDRPDYHYCNRRQNSRGAW